MRVVAAGWIARAEVPDFSDLTTATQTGPASWDGEGMDLIVPFSPEPSPAERVLIRRRLMTRDAEHEAWVAAVVDAAADVAPDSAAHRLLLLLSAALTRGIDAP